MVLEEKHFAVKADMTEANYHRKDMPKPEEKEYLMQMDGREVFMFAVKSVPQAIKEVLEKNDTAQEEISFYILHQANRRIVEAIAKRLGEPIENFR